MTESDLIEGFTEPMPLGQCELLVYAFSDMFLTVKDVILIFGSLYLTLHEIKRTMDSKSSEKRKIEEISVQVSSLSSPVPQRELLKAPDLQFDRLQPSEQDLIQEKKLEFGRFVAREAMLDEEYWVGNH